MKRYIIRFCGSIILDAKNENQMLEILVDEFQKDIYGFINIEEEEIE